MNENRRDFIRPLLTLAIVLLSIFVGMKIAQVKKAPKALQFIMPNNNSDKLSLIIDHIKKYYVDSVDINRLEEAIIPELLKELDPHSVYIPAAKVSETNEPLEGNFDGIGVSFNMANDTAIVINVIPGGPSERAGILAGDRIITVNDSLIAGIDFNQDSVVHLLRGKSGSKVTIGVKRNKEKELIPITITRGKIPLKSIDVAYMIAPEVGYIKMSKFAKTSHTEFKKALRELQTQGMKSLIFDLRRNTGGLLDQAFEITNELLPKNQLIVYTEGRAAKRKDYYANGAGMFTKDSIVILIDEGSASASEILAGAIQDNDRGTIIGRRSFGKGLVQEPVYFSDGSAMRFTIARYYTPTGRSIQRAYSNDVDEYYRDIYNRLEHGELLSVDSIVQNESLKYTTAGGKIVYGGGGIMPDIFVPLDTIGLNEYFFAVSRKNLIYKYAIEFSDTYREALKDITDLNKLNSFFADKDLINNLIRYAQKNGVKPVPEQIKDCSPIIEAHLKAYIGRSTPLDDIGFYVASNIIDTTIERAILELKETKGDKEKSDN